MADRFYREKADADRMGACLKACANIPTPALEAGVVGEMIEALRDVEKYCKAQCPAGIPALERARAILSTLTDHEESK